MTIALIDGDLIAYRAALGPQETYDWAEGGKVSIANPKAAALAAIKQVEEWADKANADDLIVALTGPDKFRTRLLPSYNHNRKGEKPVAHAAAVQSIKDKFRYHLINGLEADDILGILMTTKRYLDTGVIVSVDKDLKTIPGRLLNPLKDRKARVITETEADRWWMLQTLTGDTIDGYSGCPKVGPKKAEAVLKGLSSLPAMWRAVVDTYRSKNLTEDDALVQARMARILRREDYDKNTKEVILWQPTKTNPTRLSIGTPTPPLSGLPDQEKLQEPATGLST